MQTLQALLRDSRGSTSIEYVLIVALIAIGLTATANVLGGRISDVLASIDTTLGAPPGNNAP